MNTVKYYLRKSPLFVFDALIVPAEFYNFFEYGMF